MKSHGTKGEVVTVPVNGLPLLLHEGLEVAIVPPPLRGSRWHTVRRVSAGGSGQLAALSGVRDLAGARDLVGSTLLARETDLPEDLLLHDPVSLVGLAVRDARLGELGLIEEVMQGPANDVWVVRGESGEVLVPVVDEVVLGIVEEADEDVIEVELPRGLAPWDEGEDACS